MSSHKRLHRTSFDFDCDSLPKKRFISEENFAREMAAMSLDSQNYQNSSSKNVVRINNINDFLQEDEQQQQEGMPFMPVDKPTLVEVNFNGAVLPLELRPGDTQPRIPDFVLQNSVLSDPRDLVAYRNLMKPHKTIEVLNSPSVHSTPTSMDID